MVLQHHDYPFVRIGEACDFDPALDELAFEDDWRIEIAGTLHDAKYRSRAYAFEDVEIVLFDRWPDKEFIPQQIQTAVDAGNTSLAQKLAEGRERSNRRQGLMRRLSEVFAKPRLLRPPYRTGM